MTIKLRSLLEENNILVPRNVDSRIEKKKRIDLQRIQEYIKNGSKGDLDLRGTPLTKLPDNLTRVGRSLSIHDSSIENLNNLEYVGNLYMDNTNISELPEGLEIGGYAVVWDTPLKKRFSNKMLFMKYLEKRNIKVGGDFNLKGHIYF